LEREEDKDKGAKAQRDKGKGKAHVVDATGDTGGQLALEIRDQKEGREL